MTDTRASLIVIAPTVEEAVAKGLADLGLTADDVEVEVLDPGSRGLFGLGSRQARVRLTITAPAKQTSAEPVSEEPAAPEKQAASAEKPASVQPAEKAEPVPEPDTEPAPKQPVATQPQPTPEAVAEAEAEDEDDYALNVARETVAELLEKMKVQADVTAHYGEPDESRSRKPLHVDVHGNDLSILIGPRAETLNALQYIASLIVGKELSRSVPLVVDVEGYRQRREQQIRQLARRMADQAVKTGRRQMLEPMPASERRLVHIELRADERVTTESVGEDPRRKVTIIPTE